MPTVRDDITLSQLSYLDKPSDLNSISKDFDESDLAGRWQDMEALGWEYLGNQNDFFDYEQRNIPANGFQAHVYRDPTGKVVFAIRGTDELKDYDDDAVLGSHEDPGQFHSAIAFTKLVIEQMGWASDIHVTGHSLGGYLAQEIVKYWNESYETLATGSGFNNPGMGDGESDSDVFINIHDKSDLVNHFGGEHLGGSIDLDGNIAFWRVATAHMSAELAATIVRDYPELAITDTSDLVAMSPEARQQLATLSEEIQELREAEHQKEVESATTIRDAELSVLQSQNTLSDAINSGDGLSSVAAGLDYLSRLEDRADLYESGGTFSESEEAIADIISSGIGLGQAVDAGDDWGIAGESMNLLQDIDNYLGEIGSEYSTVISHQGSALLGLGASGIGFAQAIEAENEWGIAQSSIGVLEGIENYFRPEIQAGADAVGSAFDDALGVDAGDFGGALKGVGSVVGLGMNIASLGDIFESGDAGAIVYTVASTVNNTINTFNAATALAGNSSAAIGTIPNLGYIGAAVQLIQGDVQGAAIAASSAYLVTLGPYGWAAAAILQIGSMLFGDDDPPEASAGFSLGEDGHVIMSTGGDKDMQETASAYGSPMVALMENYKESGGRLMIDGSMPTLRVVQGEDSSIDYRSETGGSVTLMLDDMSRAMDQMRGVLYARDRGERLDSAVQVAEDIHGEIDFSRVDAIMAGHGFVKNGITYTFGETTERTGYSRGSGVFRGGGNVGPEGQHFSAKASDFTSLPLRLDQLPTQKLGDIARIVSLKNMFSGPGSELLAMALALPGGHLGLASTAQGQETVQETNRTYIKPLDGVELEEYLSGQNNFAQPVDSVDGASSQGSFPELTDTMAMQKFLSAHWSDSVRGTTPLSDIAADGVYHYRETIGYNNLLADGSRVAWLGRRQRDTSPGYLVRKTVITDESGEGGESFSEQQVEYEKDTVESFSGRRIASDELPEEIVVSLPPPGVEQGAVFIMAEDSAIRFLASELADNAQSGGYGNIEESSTFVSFGQVRNGRVRQEDNGDIRFEPTPGFVGTGSFMYTLLGPTGELVDCLATVIVKNVNDSPILQDDIFALQEGELLYLDRLLGNDTDPEGDTLLIDHLSGLENGELSVVNGRLAFTPDEGYYGNMEFSYWVRDHADSYPVMAKVSIAYTDVNQGVVATDDRFIVVEDTPLSTNVEKLLANDIEHDGETVTFAGLGAATHGTVSEDSDGTILFIPDQDYAGSEAGFHYNVQDESGHLSTGWVSVEVLDSREAPVVIAETRASILEDEVLAFTPQEVAKFAEDPDGDVLHLDIINNVTGGTIVAQNGYYTFVPDRDFSGRASFDYRVTDNHHGTVEGHLEFDITPVNDSIETGDDTLATVEEQAVVTTVIDLLANDSDVDGSVFTFVSLGSAAYGSVAMDGDGAVTFTPDSDYYGDQAGFEYLVEDSEGLGSIGWVQVQVANVNDPPEIISNTITLQEDQAITFNVATIAECIKDTDGDVITVTNIEAAMGGRVTEDGGVYTFTPHSDYNGTGSIRVTVADGNGETLTSTIALDILAAGDPSFFGDDLLTVREEKALTTSVAVLMANDSDVDGDLEFAGLGGAYHGTVAITDHGEITFIPDTDYFGSEAGFEYLVKDPTGSESTGVVTIHVENVNDPPEIIANTLASPEDQPIIFNEETISGFISDVDGDTVTLTAVDTVTGGTLQKTGSIYTFIPDANYHGPASLSYSATDTNGGVITGVLNLDILSRDDLTSFGVDSFVTREEQLLVTSVAELLAGDSDQDGNGGLEFVGLGGTSHGDVRLADDGTVEFMPDSDYFGEEAGFSYTVCDDEGTDATGWVTVKVENINDVPEIIANRIHLQEDQTLTFTPEEIAKFLVDADGELLNFDMVANVEGGSMELNNGVYTFIPDADFYGEASFDYLAKDSQGAEVAGQMYLGITPVNDLPDTSYIAIAGVEDNETILKVDDLMAGAVDVEDGTNLRFDGIDSSLHGDVYVDTQNIVHFLPDKDFYGSGFFCYKVLDSEGGVGKGYVGIDIVGVDDPPVAMDDDKILAWSNNSCENIYSAATFLANDFDADFDPLQIVSVGDVEYGTVSVDGAGNIHYISPSDNWVGVDTFRYKISDGNGSFSEAGAEIDVKINTSPDVYPELLFTREDIISILAQDDLLVNDSDIDGDTLQIIAVDQAEHCSVNLLPDGRVTFTPELNFNNLYPGQASFRYTVSDGISDPVTAVALFDIDPVNDSPILRGELISGAVEDNSFSFQVATLLANDTDVEMASPYEDDSIAFAGVWGAGHGSLNWDQNSGRINYLPEANFNGVETFSYKVVDSYGAASAVTSEIYVQPVNDMPVAQEDIGSTAEDSIWNYYSIAGLVANDYDVDGDNLFIKNPFVIEGRADVGISGGNLAIKPASHEDRVIIGYTVSDGHGGEVTSRLSIDDIVEHNYAPTFSGQYGIGWKDSNTVWFNFQAVDLNGGNSWGNYGDIVTITPSAPTTGNITQDGSNIGTGTFKFKGDAQNAALTLTVVDQAGATGTIYVKISGLSRVDGSYHYSPVVFDLDGDGVELQGVAAGVGFDWNLDGQSEGTGWVGQDDGFLVYDYNRDQVVTYANELALKEYDPEATTDLVGLRAFDTNKDGVFDGDDEEWDAFGVWQDKNSNGQTDEDEFMSLEELDIVSIELASDDNYRELDGNIVYGETRYHMVDGTVGQVADVGLNGESIEMTEVKPIQETDVLAGGTTQEDTDSEGILEEEREPAELASQQVDTVGEVDYSSFPDDIADTGRKEEDLEIVSISVEDGGSASEEEFIPFDDTDIDRAVTQLNSDIAACADTEVQLESWVESWVVSDVNCSDYDEPVIETEQDQLMVA